MSLVPRLVLVPVDHQWVPRKQDDLIEAVISTGIADAAYQKQPLWLHAGERFLDQLMFLGCAPTVEFEAPDEAAWGTASFYHIFIPEIADNIRFRSDRLSYKPRCPSCKQDLKEWRQWWGEGGTDPESCAHCGSELSPEMLNWRKRAGVGRCFIDIMGIHAETVKPVPALFDELQLQTGTGWRYFFVED
jgi:Zn ribbon nucleic-acid-binding protein